MSRRANSEFKKALADRFTSAELADFLDIDTADFVEMFEEDVELNYDDLCEFIGLRDGAGEDNYDDDYSEDS